MSITLDPPKAETSQTVINCYDILDSVLPECGFFDLTEGMYYGDPATPHEQAQRNQINWLLDQVACEKGSRILDIGCGYGTLLEAAQERGAEAIGITISPAQVQRCRERGVDVRLLNYRDIAQDWNGYFDAIIANGSAEHFVQPQDILDGRGDAVYQELFEICHRVINPASPARRFATTIIHNHENSPIRRPEELMKGPLAFRWFSGKFHFALLQNGFGGSYPALGQLQSCAKPFFELLQEVDGTHDYHLTSEEWLRRVKRSLFWREIEPRIWRKFLPALIRHPRQGVGLCFCMFIAESWQWQFRGTEPPTRLLRQVWEYQAI